MNQAGKSTLTDSLVAAAGIIAQEVVGDVRMTDTQADDGERDGLLSDAISTTKLSFGHMDNYLGTKIIDIAIKDARAKKKTVDSKMDSIMSLMREVKLREKAADKSKQELDDCSLYINAEIDELILAQQLAKEKNDKRAREVYTQKSDIATKMETLQLRVLGVLGEGDGCLANIDEMSKFLEERLASAIIKKEAADKEKLEKEVALAYHKTQMEKLLEESNKLEQEAWENLMFQDFLIERGHVINMLREEVACNCQDVNLLKEELEDCQDETEMSVTQGYLKPIIQEMPVTQDYLKPKIQEIPFTQGYLKTIIQEIPVTQDYLKPKVQEIPVTQDYLKPKIQEIPVTQDYLKPIIQASISKEDCECYKCNNISKGAKEIMRTNKICKSRLMNSKNKDMKKWIKGQIIEAVAEYDEEYML